MEHQVLSPRATRTMKAPLTAPESAQIPGMRLAQSGARLSYATQPLTGRRLHLSAVALTLLEILLSLIVLGLGAGSAIPCLLSANRVAAGNRNQNAALMLCQERIEQVVAQPFRPPFTIPSYFGAWPVPATDTVTHTETVQLCDAENGAARINGTRSTLVSLGNATLNTVRMTVRINYTYRGKDCVVEACTLRSPD